VGNIRNLDQLQFIRSGSFHSCAQHTETLQTPDCATSATIGHAACIFAVCAKRPECQHLYSNDSFTYLFFFSEQTAELVSSCLYAGSENLLSIHLCHIIFRPYHVHRLWPIATDVAYSMVSVSAVGHINGPCENDVCGQCLPDS